MDRQISIAEAKNRLTAIIHEVERGPTVKLTRHGKPVAVLLSAEKYEHLCRAHGKFWMELTGLRKIIQNDGVEIMENDLEGLRDTSTGREIGF